MTLATVMIVTGVENKTSVVTPTDKCCDYDYFCDSDE